MGKDPAFLFYTSDFLTGTAFMTDSQVGKYVRLLCYQHQQGALTRKQMLKVMGKPDPEILAKFSIKSDGRFENERMAEEVAKRSKFILSRQINGAKGGRPKASGKPSANLPKNETKNENLKRPHLKQDFTAGIADLV